MALKKTYIFIDESGDFGAEKLAGSSKFIVLTALVFKDAEELRKCEASIKELKENLKFPNDFEFKFSKLNHKFRKRFLSSLSKYSFEVYFSVQNKAFFQKSSEDLYFRLYNDLCNKLSVLEGLLYIEIDGVLDRRKKKEVIAFLRRALNESKTKITFVNSKNSLLMQFADMIAGSIRACYELLNNDFIDLFKKKIK